MNENSIKTKIIIATHKVYDMPKDSMYIPLYVGVKSSIDINSDMINLGYQRDDEGDNISEKNPYFCELTGLYWAWKNLQSDYIGLVHYRRYFSLKKRKKTLNNVLNSTELNELLENDKTKIFVPKKRHYVIETLSSHYAHTHYIQQLDETRKIILKLYPNYLNSFDAILNKRSGYMFNMFIMRDDLLELYCSWLFSILFELENKLGYCEEMSSYQQRFYGRISEILFNVWLDYNLKDGVVKKTEVKELNLLYLGKVKWGKKIKAFLSAKFFHEKYSGSF